jgi:hypothetical protein
MAFAIKNFNTITAQLILYVSGHTNALTDFNVGSVVRTMLEAFAEELEYLYLEMFRGILEGIDTGVYNSFDFPALGAVSASGSVIFSLVQTGTTNPASPTTSIVIPAGTIVQVPSINTTTGTTVGNSYSVNQDTIWPVGQTSVSTVVTCTQSGTVGNTAYNTITSIVSTLPTVAGATYAVTNPATISNGADQETAAQQKQRFAEYLQSLGRGTIDAIEYAALQTVIYDANGNIIEKVGSAVVVEPYLIDGSLPSAYVIVYVYNGVGNTSSALVAQTQNIINGYYDSNGNRIAGYKAAGVIALVLPVEESPITFNINVVMAPGYSLTSSLSGTIANSISTYIQGLSPGDSVLLNQIIEIVMNNTGVYNCYIVSPSADIIPADSTTVITIEGININAVTSITITGETQTT